MSTKTRKSHNAAFKSKVALEAVQERETINQIATRYEIHPNLVTQWKRQLLDSLPDCFSRKRLNDDKEKATNDELYQQIGKLKVENDWLKKKYESIRPGKTHVN